MHLILDPLCPSESKEKNQTAIHYLLLLLLLLATMTYNQVQSLRIKYQHIGWINRSISVFSVAFLAQEIVKMSP